MGFRLATALWGDWYVERFVGVTLPSLLAPGNLPFVLRDLDGCFDIATRDAEARAVRSSPAYTRLATLLPVSLRTLEEREVLSNPHEVHKKVWQPSLRAAAQGNDWVAFVPPDGFWADGSLAAIARQFAAGKRAVCAFHLRVDDARFLRQIGRLPNAGDHSLSIPPRELVDLALRNCAPLNCAHMRASKRMPTHAELVLFPVPGEGLLLRSIGTHLWAIAPARFAYTDHFGPARAADLAHIGYLTDSDEFAYAALMPLSQQISWYLQKQDCNARAEGIFGAHFFGHLSNDLWRHSFAFRRADATPARWAAERRRADAHMVRVYLETKAVWVHRQLKLAGLTSAAAFLASALHLVPWRRGWPRAQMMSVLAPSEAAFRAASDSMRLLEPGRESELDRFVRAHVIVGSPVGQRVVREVARNEDPLAPITVYEIDGMLK